MDPTSDFFRLTLRSFRFWNHFRSHRKGQNYDDNVNYGHNLWYSKRFCTLLRTILTGNLDLWIQFYRVRYSHVRLGHGNFIGSRKNDFWSATPLKFRVLGFSGRGYRLPHTQLAPHGTGFFRAFDWFIRDLLGVTRIS